MSPMWSITRRAMMFSCLAAPATIFRCLDGAPAFARRRDAVPVSGPVLTGSDDPAQAVGPEHRFQHRAEIRAATQHEPTVDVDHLPCHVAGGIAEQKHREVSDIFDLARPRQW